MVLPTDWERRILGWLGAIVGTCVTGLTVGRWIGSLEGFMEGSVVGLLEGMAENWEVGVAVGMTEGVGVLADRAFKLYASPTVDGAAAGSMVGSLDLCQSRLPSDSDRVLLPDFLSPLPAVPVKPSPAPVTACISSRVPQSPITRKVTPERVGATVGLLEGLGVGMVVGIIVGVDGAVVGRGDGEEGRLDMEGRWEGFQVGSLDREGLVVEVGSALDVGFLEDMG